MRAGWSSSIPRRWAASITRCLSVKLWNFIIIGLARWVWPGFGGWVCWERSSLILPASVVILKKLGSHFSKKLTRSVPFVPSGSPTKRILHLRSQLSRLSVSSDMMLMCFSRSVTLACRDSVVVSTLTMRLPSCTPSASIWVV